MWDCTVCTFKNRDELFSCQMCNFPIGAVNPFDKNPNQSMQSNYTAVAGTSSNESATNDSYDAVTEESDVSFESDDEDLYGPPLSDAELEEGLNKLRNGRISNPMRGQPPPEGQGYASVLIKFTLLITGPPQDDCSICMESLQNESGFDSNLSGVLSLTKCQHMFHSACLQQMVKDSPQHLQCPSCKAFHGHKTGIQPPGHMIVKMIQRSLPGHHDCSTIEISYNIHSGIQGPEHPNPGQRYTAVGFPRIGFLPNNTKGRKVLSLLVEAFKRRLIFTVGTSVTSGMQNVVTWNEIHHKTEFQARSGHGYPDPNYLDNVLMELSLHGVTDAGSFNITTNFHPFTIISP